MIKIAIIGAGISGLTAGRLLSKKFHVTIYEKEANIGGIARTKNVNGIAYHTVGGHCLNSKNEKVMNFIFNEILPKEEFRIIKREAKIYFHGHYISYPIEFSIKEIAKFNEELAFNMTKDFLSAENKETDNLADWFIENFGRTLALEYFIPYNKKIWKEDPSNMSYVWVKDKLPIPDKKEFFKSLIDKSYDCMPHRTFFYPKSNNQNTFIEALGKGLNIVTNFKVDSIKKSGTKWIINNKFPYDLVISTIPLNILPFLLNSVPDHIIKEAKKLKYNRVTTMLWRTKPINFTWTYYPDPSTIFHRHIHIGNFFKPKQNYTITESIGSHSFIEMVEEGRKFDYLIEPIDYNVSDHAYIVYDKDYSTAVKTIKDYFKQIGLYVLGRFGEWEYYNMDNCIESAIKLSINIEKQYLK